MCNVCIAVLDAMQRTWTSQLRTDKIFKLANQKRNTEIKASHWQPALINLISVMKIKHTHNFNNIFYYFSPPLRDKRESFGVWEL
jgi:hypothetical protein